MLWVYYQSAFYHKKRWSSMKWIKSILFFIVAYLLFTGGKYFYMQPNVSGGELAHDFSINENLKLSDFKGKYVLLDFWGSWCGPCMADVPKLKALHQQFDTQQFSDASDFEIIGVAVESKERNWQRAMDRLQLPWKHQVLDLATNLRFFDSPIANSYGVKEVPTKFLISPQGEIIAVNMPFGEMENFLSEKLK